ncbi:hypothetical protein [Thiorhodococcus minor]|uniref:Uncharacterized protein n=1 Tax=Thiorhodococcus minor TaxID=57489 RepID=A0A6M0JTR6_9GAMM|nr:hypothetical protein [Thiorhodococcus minor]NEV60940.1 hypothetical protein [Thiorhodococcus minor]
MQLKLAILAIVLVIAGVGSYVLFSSNEGVMEGAGAIVEGVGTAVETVGEGVEQAGEGIGLVTPEEKLKTKRVSEDCTSNAECKNNACGRIDAGSGALVCCPSGSIATYAGFDYCTQIADGRPCWSDVMCASGHCRDNKGGLQKGTCSQLARVGETCSVDSDCDNHACGRATAAENTSLTCCASGNTTRYAGYDYCASMADNSSCWSDAMCASGYCKGNAGGVQRGTCKSRGRVGAACSSNADCINNACARATAAEDTSLTCCASGDTRTYAGFDYCSSMRKGSTCWSDAMCASGTCKGNMGGLQRGTCT